MSVFESQIPKPVPAIKREHDLNRRLERSAAFDWLRAGWSDFKSVNMEASLLYGVVVFLVSVVIVGGLFLLKLDYVLFPALSGFVIMGPALASGLYVKSKRIAQNEPVSIIDMLLVKSGSKGQTLFLGVLLSLLIMLWIRVAVLLYALFFGVKPFVNIAELPVIFFTTVDGLLLLVIGTLFGGLFAAFAFAISAFSFPILLNESSDAFSAAGASMVLVWNNLPVMLTWGAIVMCLSAVSLLTGFVALIVVYPVLGHATWHAYVAIRGEPGTPVVGPAIPD